MAAVQLENLLISQKQGNELSSPPKSGGPKLSKRFVSKVKSIVDKENTKEEGCLTYNLVHDQLKRKGYNCSIKKVVRVLHNSGYTRMAKARNCDLTERHKALRVALANDLLSHPPRKLDNIIWDRRKTLSVCCSWGWAFFYWEKGGPQKANAGMSHADAHKVMGETILRAFKKRQGCLEYLKEMGEI